MEKRPRPTIVTVLAVLAVCLGSVFLLGSVIGSLAVLAIGVATGASHGVSSQMAAVTLASFAALFVSSFLYLAFAMGVFAAPQLARRLGLAGAALGLASIAIALLGGIVGEYLSVLVSLAFAIAMIYGLTRTSPARSYFDRA